MAEEDLIFGKNRHFFGGIEPSNMLAFSVAVESGVVKVTATLPNDTVVNNQTLCTVEGAIIRRKTTDYPKDEFDGDLVANIKASTVFADSGASPTGTYYYAAFPYTTQGVYNRNKANCVVVNEPEPMQEFSAKSVYVSASDTVKVEITAKLPSGVAGAVIRRSTTGYPTSETEGELFKNITENGTYTDTNVTVGVVYYYSAFPYTSTGAYNRSEANRTSVTPKKRDYLFGYDLVKATSSPTGRVTYPSDVDNAAFTPAAMNFSTGKFNYGGWAFDPGEKFMPRPCMLTYAGVVDHYLNPNDYTKKVNGTTSKVTDTSFGGNAMMEWPKIYPGQTPQQNSDGILSGATVWDGYKLNASSPLIDAGIYVPQMGTTDFYGTQLYWGNAPDIGVHEYQQGEYNNPSNFALGKTVTSNNSHESLTPDLMVDGIYSQNSRWAAANSDLPIWLDIDFGKDTTFNKVVLTENIVSGWASPRIASFNLQIPTADGYQTIYTYDGEIGEGKDFTFDTVTASHLRMEITSLRADTSTHGRGETNPSIVEFEVYKVPVIREPQNLLLNKSVSASSSHPSCPASKVNDGDASQGSRWAAANSDLPAWLEFNLGSEQTFNSVTITENIVPNWASERITGLEFQAWNGTEYTTISTYSGTIGTSKTISLPETTSSKFKALITGLQEDTTKNSKGQTDPSIQEIELYYR